MGAVPLEPADDHTRRSIVAFLGVRDLGRYACCSRAADRDAGAESVWADLFDRTWRPRGTLPREVQAQAERPYGPEAIGFGVSVFYPELNACLAGTVKGYRPATNEYLVRYAAPRPGDHAREAWELEARTDAAVRANPALASSSRIRFLQPPAGAPAEPIARSAVRCAPGAGPGRPHRFPTWREELRHVMAHTPSRLLARLEDHSDEVLFASFSPCGRRLATCSRDCTTCIYSFGQDGMPALEAALQHSSAVAHLQWCPDLEFDYIAVSTDGPSLPMAEVWHVGRRECLLRVASPVRDVYGSIVRWPAGGLALVASGALDLEGEYVQELIAYAIPPFDLSTARTEPARGDRRVGGMSGQMPLARLLLRGALNYFHCLEPAANAAGPAGRFAALSGTGPRQCDVVALLDLPSAEDVRGGGSLRGAAFELAPRARELRGHGVLSVRWAQGGRLLLVNARPRVEGCCELPRAGETMARAIRRPAPPLRTGFELLILDASTLETLSVHDGHHAFTTADAPFIVHADAWADSDLVASGGEDACVHVWHRSHGHRLARLEAHTRAVNAVAWSQALRLMVSASDDHTVVVWSCASARSSS